LKPDDIRFQLFLGDVSFAAGKIGESIAAYDAAIRIDPDFEPRLWQRGLALFCADRFANGVKQVETHLTVNSQDGQQASGKLNPITINSRESKVFHGCECPLPS
jgi:lipoprotein NlpI